ncbi:serine/threonine-protein kinase [Lentzea aerocolonigenes]|uniref:serine/threonine-protein kinase n=1 Tax=Lentzea aerocolonigenes TaxID=68170 RepID=UPI001E4E7A92|nr:serine/threonine-protein kinase [Lentzea aerocolonigenes]
MGNRRYRLVRELGRGGMGAVWLGQDTVLGRDVAVKELLLPGNVPAAERAVYQERVLREARIASQLQDPAIVTVHDLISEDDQTFIVMELIKAPTLDESVDLDGPLGVKAAATLAMQLLNALEAAHSAGVVHRDVKPGNVMVPGKGTAKLTDFGIAQSIDDPRLTATGTLIGSPAYMSPERLAGGEAMPAWDLWALGATLFYATEGRGAFDRPTTSATILAVMNERPVPRVTGPLGELITGLLEPDPNRRLSAAAAHRLIERALHSTGSELTQQLEPVEPPAPAPVISGPMTVDSMVMAPPVILPPAPPGRRRPIALILSATLTPLFLVGALVLLYFTVFKPMLEGAGLTGPESTPAMQPVLTLGPGGDLPYDGLRAFQKDCLKWTPAKGAREIKTGDEVGCYLEHETEVLDTFPANFDTEKDVPYPGTAELTKIGGTGCTRTFLSSKVTGQDKEKTLRYWVVIPTEEAWKVKTENGYRRSSRIVHCFVGKADGTAIMGPLMQS